MSLRARRSLFWVARLAVSAFLIAIVFRTVKLSDRVKLSDGSEVSGRVLERAGGGGGTERVLIRDGTGVVRELLVASSDGPSSAVAYGLLSAFRSIRPDLYLLAMAGFLVAILATSLRWWLLLRAEGICVRFPSALRLTWVGLFFNNILLGVAGGDMVKAAYVSRDTERKAEAVTSVFLDRGMGLATLAALASAALLWRAGAGDSGGLFWVSCSFLVLLAGLWFCFSRRALARALRSGRAAAWAPFGQLLGRVSDSLRVLSGSRSLLAFLILLSLANHLATICSVFVLSKAIAMTCSFVNFLAFVPVINFLSALPVSMGGWGVGEAAYVRLLGRVGVPAEASATLSILFRLSAGVLLSLPGLAFMQRTGPERGQSLQHSPSADGRQPGDVEKDVGGPGGVADPASGRSAGEGGILAGGISVRM